MPVPISVTHAKKAGAVGLDAAQHTELPSEGPFARAAAFNKKLAEENAAADVAPKAQVAASDQQPTPATDAAAVPATTAALSTQNLNFWYTDIGTYAILTQSLTRANFIPLV
jgi:hypothetical protein